MAKFHSTWLKFLLSDKTLVIPDLRRSLEPMNLRWLQRNIKINNADHSNVSEILKLIREVTRG